LSLRCRLCPQGLSHQRTSPPIPSHSPVPVRFHCSVVLLSRPEVCSGSAETRCGIGSSTRRDARAADHGTHCGSGISTGWEGASLDSTLTLVAFLAGGWRVSLPNRQKGSLAKWCPLWRRFLPLGTLWRLREPELST